jgi:hypothetical protein
MSDGVVHSARPSAPAVVSCGDRFFVVEPVNNCLLMDRHCGSVAIHRDFVFSLVRCHDDIPHTGRGTYHNPHAQGPPLRLSGLNNSPASRKLAPCGATTKALAAVRRIRFTLSIAMWLLVPRGHRHSMSPTRAPRTCYWSTTPSPASLRSPLQ